ncbi:MAG TPA: hypothetical protein VGJ81_09835 [Thermoanaerobaculia bacterium]
MSRQDDRVDNIVLGDIANGCVAEAGVLPPLPPSSTVGAKTNTPQLTPPPQPTSKEPK